MKRFVYCIEISSKSVNGGHNYHIEMYDTKEEYHVTSRKINTGSHRGFENEACRFATHIFKTRVAPKNSYMLGIFVSNKKYT